LPFPQNHILPQISVSGDLFNSWTNCLGAGDTSCRLQSAVEGIVPSRRRSQNAQGNLSHRQKRRFLITEKGSPVTLNASLAGMVFDPVSDRRIHCVPLNL
jgi:hypothetical protein